MHGQQQAQQHSTWLSLLSANVTQRHNPAEHLLMHGITLLVFVCLLLYFFNTAIRHAF